jgi:hypothetical protein
MLTSAQFLSFMWNPLSWVMEAAALVAIALSNGEGRAPDWQVGRFPYLRRSWHSLPFPLHSCLSLSSLGLLLAFASLFLLSHSIQSHFISIQLF